MAEFRENFRKLSDEKLIEAYRTREDYEPEAAGDLIAEMESRGLQEHIDLINRAEAEEKKQIQEESEYYHEMAAASAETEYEQNTFGDVVSDEEYAQNAENSFGELHVANVNAIQSRTAFYAMVVIGIVLVIIPLAFLFTDGEIPTFGIISGIVGLMVFAGGFILKGSSASQLKLFRDTQRQLVFEAGTGNGRTVVRHPFKVYFFAETIVRRAGDQRISAVRLHMVVRKDKRIKLYVWEDLGTFEEFPYGWEEKSLNISGGSWPEFWGAGKGGPQLRKLKKIWDGLEKQMNRV